MTFITRVRLLFQLLTSAVMCFARNNPEGDLNSYHNIDDYDCPGANPKRDPRIPRPPRPGNQKMQISEEDYAGTRPNPKHDSFTPPPPFDE